VATPAFALTGTRSFAHPVRTHPAAPDRRRSEPQRSRVLDVPTVLSLQRSAGNAAVAPLLVSAPPTVQRGLFDMLGGMLGGGDLRQQAAGIAGQGVQAGVGALAGRIGGPFGEILGGAGSGLAGAAGSLISGNSGAALDTLRQTGMAAAGPAAQTGLGMLGGAVGGQAGQFIGGLGPSVGQGLSSIISGGSPGEAGMGVLNAASPGLMGLASRFLGGI
jgi:hypothetical protein